MMTVCAVIGAAVAVTACAGGYADNDATLPPAKVAVEPAIAPVTADVPMAVRLAQFVVSN